MSIIAITLPCRSRPRIGYVVAILLSLLALYVRLEMGPALSGFPFLTFFLAVALATVIGGIGPGILAALLTGLIAYFYMLGPSGMLVLGWRAEWIAMGFYWLTMGCFIAILHNLIGTHDAQLRAEGRLRALNADLERRVSERTAELTHALNDRALAEERLRESEEHYRHIIELGTQAPWTADPEGRLLSIGDRSLELAGCASEELMGDGWIRLLHPDDAARVMAGWRNAVTHYRRFDFECRMRTADGSFRWCRACASPRIGDDGRVIRWYGTIEDIDDRRQADARLMRMQSELIHVSRLSEMGAMASTLAHELNQPLTAIANYVRGSRRVLGDVPGEAIAKARDALIEAERSAVHAGEIIRRLRDLVAPGDVRRHREHLPDLINEACSLAMVDAATLGVSYRLDLDREATTVLVDRIQIEQVLINLLRNAIDAVRDVPVREIVIATAARRNGHCEVSVRDSGAGIAPEAAQRLFEPFNTTKPEGLGIGLSISRTIIEAHEGQIWSEAAPDGGAVLRFTLPRA
jgi:PAS domain S-box-containing protein